MNDVPLFIVYADDTTLFSALVSPLSLDISASCELKNRDLSHVGEWLIRNRLSINISKTFHPRQKDISHVTLELTLNGDKIASITLIFSGWLNTKKHISWKYHREMISDKILKHCGVLSRLKNYLLLFILRRIYFNMVHSLQNYGLFA